MTLVPSGPAPAAGRLLAWREVRQLTGLSRTTAWRLQNARRFPRPVEISPGRVAWRESDVAAWTARLAPRATETVKSNGAVQAGPPSGLATEPSPPPPDQTPPPPGPPAAPRPRRRPAVSANQMSFDF